MHYDSGLIKVGSVSPHMRGCTVWSDEGLLPTQKCVGQGPAGATGLVLREGVVTVVTPEESALAQQLPEEWVLEHTLTQEQVGNAVPLGLAFHLGVRLASYLHPLLLAREEEGGGATASQHCAPSSPKNKMFPSSRACRALRARKRPGSKVCMHELRMVGFSRRAAKLIEWKRWCWLQKRCLSDTLSQLQTSKKATPRDLRRWRAEDHPRGAELRLRVDLEPLRRRLPGAGALVRSEDEQQVVVLVLLLHRAADADAQRNSHL